MAAAAAEIAVEGGANVAVARAGVALEQRVRLNDHARRAVAALGGLLVDERLLQAAGLAFLHETFERHDRAAGGGRRLGRARADRLAVEQHGAGAALRLAATEARAVDAEIV